MEQYRLLAECLLPARMLDWFDLKTIRVEKKGDTQVIHLYLDENEQKPDDGEEDGASGGAWSHSSLREPYLSVRHASERAKGCWLYRNGLKPKAH